jgi:hypothetical protein
MGEVFFMSWPAIRCHVIFVLIEDEVIRPTEDSETRQPFVANGTRQAAVMARADHPWQKIGAGGPLRRLGVPSRMIT